MSSAEEEQAAEVCAYCGKAEVDDIKLKKCTACLLVKYCSVDCQKNHWKQHKKACRVRVVEIRDDRLFQQPEISHYGECPICCLPLPLDENKSPLYSCCCKLICDGCELANQKREIEQGMEMRCPYCREPVPETLEETNQHYMIRIKANDPFALCQVGKKCRDEGDCSRAFQYFTKAAGLGDIGAHFEVSVLYRKGDGVERDIKKEIYHLEEAAIGGHPYARFNLACIEEQKHGNFDRAVKHLVIAAKLGLDEALEEVKEGFLEGLVSKEDYEAALRGHQAAVDATKSEQREEAEEFYKRYRAG